MLDEPAGKQRACTALATPAVHKHTAMSITTSLSLGISTSWHHEHLLHGCQCIICLLHAGGLIVGHGDEEVAYGQACTCDTGGNVCYCRKFFAAARGRTHVTCNVLHTSGNPQSTVPA